MVVQIVLVVALAMAGAERVVRLAASPLSAATEALLGEDSTSSLPRISRVVQSDLAPLRAFEEKEVEIVLPRTLETKGFGVSSVSLSRNTRESTAEPTLQDTVTTVTLHGSTCQLFSQSVEYEEKSVFYSAASTFHWGVETLERNGELFFLADNQILVHRLQSDTTYKLNLELAVAKFSFNGDFLVAVSSEKAVFLLKIGEDWVERMSFEVRDSAGAQFHLLESSLVYFSSDNSVKTVERDSLETVSSYSLGGVAVDSVVHKNTLFVAVRERGVVSFELPSLQKRGFEYNNPSIAQLGLFTHATQGETYLECVMQRGPEVLVEFGLGSVERVNRVVVWREEEASHTWDSEFHYFGVAERVVFFQRGLSSQANTQVYSLNSSCSPSCRLVKVRGESGYGLAVVRGESAAVLWSVRVSAERLKCVFQEEGEYKARVSLEGDECSSVEEKRVCEENIVLSFKVESEFKGNTRLLRVGLVVLSVIVGLGVWGYVLSVTKCCLENPLKKVRSNKVGDIGELVSSSENSSRKSNRV